MAPRIGSWGRRAGPAAAPRACGRQGKTRSRRPGSCRAAAAAPRAQPRPTLLARPGAGGPSARGASHLHSLSGLRLPVCSASQSRNRALALRAPVRTSWHPCAGAKPGRNDPKAFQAGPGRMIPKRGYSRRLFKIPSCFQCGAKASQRFEAP
jgi:hypothetical protein